ncbi:rhomboid family intramembrane serine protease [Epidermidibacterium keratini]|uniref:Rhomboid family intramembrane serine protease n=1 Tax=Epidermidibacterium keratini TaxID=1891644 RepID=A0A7L4YME0_9ACTN|nr:rhomboid family intramembrane serine protease [Epidermidibacterium keratini]QHC00451.1 rhomboid family intramembrane serine protease [Epidermidibacterium keratini]
MTHPPYPNEGPEQGPPQYAAGAGAQPGQAASCYRHQDRQTGLRCQRCNRPACHECLNEAPVGYQCNDCVREGRASVRQPSRAKSMAARYRSVGPITAGLIAINVLMYVVTAVDARSISNNQFSEIFFQLAMWPPAVEAGQWWRLVTAGFLHFGLIHLGVNMLSLWIIGRDLEVALGRVRYLAVYLLAGIGGSLAVLWFGGANSLLAGASGSVFGLLGALGVVLVITRQPLNGLIAVLALNAIISLTPGISLLAHLGGLITGVLVALAVLPWNRIRAARRR